MSDSATATTTGSTVCPRCRASGTLIELPTLDTPCRGCNTRWKRGPLGQMTAVGQAVTVMYESAEVAVYPRPGWWPLGFHTSITGDEAGALLDTLAYLHRQCGTPGAERLAWTDLPQPELDDRVRPWG